MHVYYQAEDLTVRELTGSSTDGSWNTGTTLPGPTDPSLTPCEGTAIASVGSSPSNIHTYYQDTNNGLWEATYDGTSWTATPLNVSVALKAKTPIAAMSQSESNVSGQLDLQVFPVTTFVANIGLSRPPVRVHRGKRCSRVLLRPRHWLVFPNAPESRGCPSRSGFGHFCCMVRARK